MSKDADNPTPGSGHDAVPHPGGRDAGTVEPDAAREPAPAVGPAAAGEPAEPAGAPGPAEHVGAPGPAEHVEQFPATTLGSVPAAEPIPAPAPAAALPGQPGAQASEQAEGAPASDVGILDGGEAGSDELVTPVLSEVLLAVEELWPESLAEDWDRVGLVAGRPDADVDRIMFAVDPTLEVIDEALEWGAKLLVTHHPLLLAGVNSVAATTGKGRAVHRLIEGGCALLTIHTNGDSAVGGVSDVLADALGLEEVSPLMPAAHGLVEEGIGRVGMLPGVEKLGELASRIFLTLPAVAGGVRVAGDRDALVRKVAVCGGAGDGLFDAVRASDADVYVTADLRHHPASEARESSTDGRPYLIDLSHFASEWLWLPVAAQALANVLADQGFEAELAVSQTNTDPWDFILTPGS